MRNFYSTFIDQMCHYLLVKCVNLNRQTQFLYNFTHVCEQKWRSSLHKWQTNVICLFRSNLLCYCKSLY